MLNILSKILWAIATIIILSCGLYYTKKLKFIQFKLKRIFNSLKTEDNVTITPFKILMMTLAGKIGVGSIAGISLAIYIGGVGSVFWIWASSLIVAAVAFVESMLGIIYKEKDGNHYKGGPSFYIDKGLNKKRLAKIYALLIIVSYIFGFLSIQANTISISINNSFGFDRLTIGIILAILTLFMIIKGLSSITKATEIIVPLMGICYLGGGLFVVFNNISLVPDILKEIITEAFTFKSFTSGMIMSLIIGMQRGIFSNEAGIGTAAIATGASDSSDYIGGGLIQILGIYFTSLIICTTTAIVVLTSNYTDIAFTSMNGIELTQYALNFHMGKFGDIILLLSIFLFAFSTIITSYYYGESNLKYLFPNISKKALIILKIVIVILIVYGSVASATLLWNIVDVLVAMLAIINIYAIYKLKDVVKRRCSNDWK